MHPIERLRSLARATWLDPATVAVEATDSLGDALRWMDEPTAVSIARRLLAWHSFCGPLWWSTARVLHAVDPTAEAEVVVRALLDDPTGLLLDAALPDDAQPLLVGAAPGFDTLEDRGALLLGGGRRALGRWTPPSEAADLVAAHSHVLVGVSAFGPGGAFAPAPAALLADAAADAGTPVWAVCGVGTVVDAVLWNRLVDVVAAGGRQRPATRSDAWWDDDAGAHGGHGDAAALPEVVAIERFSFVAGPDGLVPPADALRDAPTTPVDLLSAAGAEPY